MGFEAVILSFGSGFDPSSTNASYISRVAADTAYAKSLGIEMGGYTLMQNPRNLTGNDTCHSPDGRAGPLPILTRTRTRTRARARTLSRTLSLSLTLTLTLTLTRSSWAARRCWW